MLIQQIICQQAISILDKILEKNLGQNVKISQRQNKYGNQDQKYTIKKYSQTLINEKIIKQEEKQILMILLQNYLQQNQGQQGRNVTKQKLSEIQFDESEAYVMIKQIKRDIISKKQQNKEKGKINQQKLVETKQKAEVNYKMQNEFEEAMNQKTLSVKDNKIRQLTQSKQDKKLKEFPFLQEPNTQQLNKQKQLHLLSKKLKKQNQFITRNINRIKSYSTVNPHQPTIDSSHNLKPLLEQQLKISYDVSHKLFHLYKAIYPKNNKETQSLNFQNKEYYKTTLNYYKILQILIDAGFKFQIQNKLSLLRIIKKLSFNQNFISLEQWVKIYKTIINNLNVKEVNLQRLARIKEEQKKLGKYFVPLLKNKLLKPQQYRSRKIKTQTSIPENKYYSITSINHDNSNKNLSKMQFNENISGIKFLQNNSSKLQLKNSNANQYRSRHKKLLTDVNQVVIKNIRKQLRSQKMIGLIQNKKQDKNSIKNIINQSIESLNGNNENSYLRKAMTNKKISKFSWQNLFEMRQDTMPYTIVIPSFALQIDDDT